MRRCIPPLLAVSFLIVCSATSTSLGIVGGTTDQTLLNDPDSPYFGMTTDYVGRTGIGSAVAVSGRYALTLRHVAASAGSTIQMAGQTYYVQEVIDAPDLGQFWPPDLRLLKVSSLIETHVDLFTGSLTAGDDLMVVGTGYDGTIDAANDLWDWDTSTDRELRWGTNQYDTDTWSIYDTCYSNTLQIEFDADATVYECGIGAGDSGGGVFVQDTDGDWKLAGLSGYVNRINGASPPYNVFYAVSMPAYADWIEDTMRLLADVDGSGATDPQDVDVLRANFGSGDSLFDLNADGLVDNGDLAYMIHDVLDTELADLNFDGLVNVTDLAILRSNYGQPGGYGNGDISGDGWVTLTDFFILRSYLGFDTNAAPEPATLAVLGLGAMALLRRRK